MLRRIGAAATATGVGVSGTASAEIEIDREPDVSGIAGEVALTEPSTDEELSELSVDASDRVLETDPDAETSYDDRFQYRPDRLRVPSVRLLWAHANGLLTVTWAASYSSVGTRERLPTCRLAVASEADTIRFGNDRLRRAERERPVP